MQTSLSLELYYEVEGDRSLAEDAKAGILQLANELAPHINLTVDLLPISDRDDSMEVPSAPFLVPIHHPSFAGLQSLLITRQTIGAQGWGRPGTGCVSSQALVAKREAGGNPGDILIHEWLHTLSGLEINGRVVPFADDAERFGFDPIKGPDDENRWPSWYQYALGGPDSGTHAAH